MTQQFIRDYPFIQSGITYNSAFQPKDLINGLDSVKNNYITTDFLYNAGGKFMKNVRLVAPNDVKGFFERLKANIIPSGIQGHSITNFGKLYGM